MRVLFYHSVPGWSGSARAFAAAAAGLAERGYQVTFSCPPDSETEERLAHGALAGVAIGAWLARTTEVRPLTLALPLMAQSPAQPVANAAAMTLVLVPS